MKNIRGLVIGAGLLAVTTIMGQTPVDSATLAKTADVFLPAMNADGPMPSLIHAFDGIKVNGNPLQLQTVGDLTTMLELLESEPPIPLAALPKKQAAAGFWSLKNPDWPPLPGNAYGMPIWNLGNGNIIIDDRNFDWDAAEAAAQAALVASQPKALMSSLATAYAYGNPVYLTNMAASYAADGSITASFSIAGGTNFVPYDILTTTNLALPRASWNWLGFGYTSNNFTLTNQSANLSFYILAKPSKTMTVGFGDDTYGQCDVPYGLTNAAQVAGGLTHSLALENDGTMSAWGSNNYGEGAVPANVSNVVMIAAGFNFSAALLTNGTVMEWGSLPAPIPASLTNGTAKTAVISAQANHTLALTTNGTVFAWGTAPFGADSVPTSLANVTAIAAGGAHSLAVSNGYVLAWGYDGFGEIDVPAGLSNVVDVAAGYYHSVALLKNGTVVAWGDNANGEINVPAGLSNVVAIAAGGYPGHNDYYTMALKQDGTVVAWGGGLTTGPFGGLNHVVSIAGGTDHALAVRTGPATPVITQEPMSQYFLTAGGNFTFTNRGAGLYGVGYQWQTNGVNLPGATNLTLTVTNVQFAGTNISYRCVVSNEVGTVISSNATTGLVTSPVFTFQTTPTNIAGIYGDTNYISATAAAPGQANGFPIYYHWLINSEVVSNYVLPNYPFSYFSFVISGNSTYTLIASNAAGTSSVSWNVTIKPSLANAINVTNDLLLIYNTNSQDSRTVLNNYLAHRPGVGGANVLGIGYTNSQSPGWYETISPTDLTNLIVNPIGTWLTNNPAKRPQYVILFLDVPCRVFPITTYPTNGNYPSDQGHPLPGVSQQLRFITSDWDPLVTCINMNGTNDCLAYINKLEYFGTNFSPGKLVISASAGNYGNTNYYFDAVGLTVPNLSGLDASNAVVRFGGSPLAVVYTNYTGTGAEPHIHNGFNAAGYFCLGAHSSLGSQYALDGSVKWTNDSSWWIMETGESFNGLRVDPGQGTFMQWFSSNAFGGTNYSSTPIGAVTHVDEPSVPGINDASTFFGLWQAGKNFAICAWASRYTYEIQVVGDPFVTR